LSGGVAHRTPALVPERPRAHRRVKAVLTVTIGSGAPIVLVDVDDAHDWARLLASLRNMFDNDEARSEGWSTALLGEGFQALRDGRAVTFRRRVA
jgi:hypothetical protein